MPGSPLLLPQPRGEGTAVILVVNVRVFRVPGAGCEGAGVRAGAGDGHRPHPQPQTLGTIGSSSPWAAVNYGHLLAASAAGSPGRRHRLGSAPTSASPGLPGDHGPWEPAAHPAATVRPPPRAPSPTGSPRSPPKLCFAEKCNGPGAARAPTGACRSPAAGKGQSAA